MKMRHYPIKSCVTILALVLLCVFTFSCGENLSEAGSNAATENSGEVPIGGTATEAAAIPKPPKGDYNGYVFRVGQGDPSHSIREKLVVVEELDGDLVNDAIYNRNNNAAERTNTIIKSVAMESYSALKNSVLAGDDFCDVALADPYNFYSSIGSGILIDVNTIDTLDTSNPWWDQNQVSELDIYGKLFSLVGDITTTDEFHTVCLIYSCNLFEDFGFDSPYSMVEDGSWTLDRFLDMCRDVAADIDGDGVMGEFDRWGFTTESAMMSWMCDSFGARSILRDSEGEFSLNVNDSLVRSIIDSVIRLATEKNIVTMAGDGIITASTYGDVYYHMEALFAQDLALFHSGTFDDLTRMRSYDADYGIVPLPKFNESQEKFYHSVSWTGVQLVIPATVENTDLVGTVLENMGWESHFTLNPVFYELFISEKLARDEKSKAMLDMIFSTKYYSLDDYANISGLNTIINKIAASKENTFASDWAANEAKAVANLSKFLEPFRK